MTSDAPQCLFVVWRPKKKTCHRKAIACITMDVRACTLDDPIGKSKRQDFFTCAECANRILGSDQYDLSPSIKRIRFL